MELRGNYYRQTKLCNLEEGDQFNYNGVDFELVSTKHAIMVGLTIDEIDNNGKLAKQIGTFSDTQLVLVKIKEPIKNA